MTAVQGQVSCAAVVHVVCAAAGIELAVPAVVSILDAVRSAGLPVPSPCGGGSCGACETRVLEGEPDHRDALLTADERRYGDTMLICVSRARGDRLVLDL